MNREIEEKISKVVENFDFDKVHRFMVQTNWKWINSEWNLEIPSKDRLIKEATGLLNYVAHKYNHYKKEYSVGAGGFEASVCYDGTLCLKFLVFKQE